MRAVPWLPPVRRRRRRQARTSAQGRQCSWWAAVAAAASVLGDSSRTPRFSRSAPVHRPRRAGNTASWLASPHPAACAGTRTGSRGAGSELRRRSEGSLERHHLVRVERHLSAPATTACEGDARSPSRVERLSSTALTDGVVEPTAGPKALTKYLVTRVRRSRLQLVLLRWCRRGGSRWDGRSGR
jgi:hypothetical protein